MTEQVINFTQEDLERALKRAGGVLRKGSHDEPPAEGGCEACVRELRTLALWEAGSLIEWSDHPDEVEWYSTTDDVCTAINDARWSSDHARTDGCLPLVWLSEANAAERWERALWLHVIRVFLPALGFNREICESVTDAERAHEVLLLASCLNNHWIWCGRMEMAFIGEHTAIDVVAACLDNHLTDEQLGLLVDILIKCHRGEWTA